MAYGHKLGTKQRNAGHNTECGVDSRARSGSGGHKRYEDSATDGVGSSPSAGKMKQGGRSKRSKSY